MTCDRARSLTDWFRFDTKSLEQNFFLQIIIYDIESLLLRSHFGSLDLEAEGLEEDPAESSYIGPQLYSRHDLAHLEKCGLERFLPVVGQGVCQQLTWRQQVSEHDGQMVQLEKNTLFRGKCIQVHEMR